jgi:TRAP-type C4-dicarboxylate transport system permease small subunit
MGVMVLNVLWQVASRYLLDSPSSFTDELAGFLMIWVGLLGAAYATGKGLHLAIDIVYDMAGILTKRRLLYLINLLIILFALSVLVIGGSRLVYLTLYLKQLSATLEVPLGYVYLVLPLSGLLIIYYCIHTMVSLKSTAYESE